MNSEAMQLRPYLKLLLAVLLGIISAIVFNPVAQAETMKLLDVVVFLMIGAGVFTGVDYLVDKNLGKEGGAGACFVGTTVASDTGSRVAAFAAIGSWREERR